MKFWDDQGYQKEGKQNRYSWLFLLEITLVLLILVFGLGVILRVNLKARELSGEAEDQGIADRWIQNTDALIRASDSEEEFLQFLKKTYPDCEIQKSLRGQDRLIRMEDSDSKKDTAFQIQINYRLDKDGMLHGRISVLKEAAKEASGNSVLKKKNSGKKIDQEEIRHYFSKEDGRYEE
ncbi:hypothetical protein ACKX2L_01740 [Lachnospiraceae bacterium YH-ros2228]